MHYSVHQFFNEDTTPDMFKDKRVIEVGSLDVNGSVRDHIVAQAPSEYIGVDFVEGLGVDQLVNAEELVEEFGKRSFDTVVSTEMLEHAENWRDCIQNMKDICKDWLIITTRGPGFPFHAFPHDYWRYTCDDFEKIFADYEIKVLKDDPEWPGVFMVARKTRRKAVDLSKIEVAPVEQPQFMV